MSLNPCLKEQIQTIAVETNEIESNKESQDLFVEEIHKSDSGMEEESFITSAGLSDSSDNELDEIFVKKRTRGNKRMIIDDEDEKNEEVLPVVNPFEDDDQDEKESDSVSKIIEDNEDGEHENSRLFIDTHSEEENDETTEKLNSEHENSRLFIDTHSEEENDEKTEKLDLKKNSDLFDAELSDEDRSAVPANTGDVSDEEDAGNLNSDVSDSEKNSDSNDEGFVENQLNPELIKKLKKLKGAAKKGKERTKYERKSKPKADQMLELYSDSQKLVRESRINLPYYEPETKSLNDFLARATRKRQEYAGLKRAKDIVKAQIIQDKLSVSILPSQPANLNSRKWASQDMAKKAQQIEISPSKDVDRCQKDHEDDVISSSQGSTVCQQHGTSLFPALVGSTEMEDDELPDITARNWDFPPAADDLTKSSPLDLKESVGDQTNGPTKETSHSHNTSGHSDTCGLEELPLSPTIGICSDTNTFNFETKCDKKDVPALEKNQSADLFLSANSVAIESPEPGVDSSCKGLPDEVSCTAETILLTASSTQTTTPKPNPSDENEIQSDTVKQRKRSLLERLRGIELPSVPHLSGSPSDVICLAEPSTETPKNPGVLKLMNKLAEHSKPRTPRAAHKVNLSIISKEGEEGSKKELKLHSLTYSVNKEEDTLVDDTPGSKLLKLKQQLDVGMRQKRQEARQRRLQLYALENEEGFEGEKEEEPEELEEDMTDSSGEEEEEEEEEEENDLMEDFGNESADDKDYNPLIDNEAEEDSDEEEEDGRPSGKDDDFNQDSNDIRLHFDATDEESDDEDDITVSRKKRPSKAVVDSDVESNNEADYSDVENEAPTQKLESQTEKDSLSDSGRDPLLGLWSCDEETTKETNNRDKFRRENSKSPEIYTFDPSQSDLINSGHQSDSSQFLTSGPIIDGDGFIVRTQACETKNVSGSAISKLSSLVNSGSEDLMPGNIFKDFGSQQASQVFTPGNIFQDFKTQPLCGERKENGLGKEEQKLGSLSNFGKKTIISEGFQSSKELKLPDKHSSRNSFSDEDDRDIYDPFSVLSKKEEKDISKKHKFIKPVLTDSEDENNDSDASGDDLLASEKENDHTDREGDTDIDDEASQPEKEDFHFKGFKDKKKGIRKEFIEDEAELSGSEYESDEDVDLAEADDILEEEEGDRDLAGVSEEQLREEVGRVHMKRLQDDDDREIMFFKERYLQDGDLYSEGAGRMRNFRWKNSDADSQQDMFNVSDDEQQEEDNDEQQWRKDRYEREKFLEDIDPNPDNENSQLLKLGHVFLKKKESFSSKENTPAPKQKMLPPEPPKLSKKGSFLSRKDDSLIKIAQVTKSLGAITKNSKNFIFQSVDQGETQEVISGKDVTAPPKRKAHITSHSEHPAKKVKLADSPVIQPPKRRESIFNLLE